MLSDRHFELRLSHIVVNRPVRRARRDGPGGGRLVTVGTEIGSGGTISIDTLAICHKGVRNAFAHLGVLPPDHTACAPSERRSEGERRDEVMRLPKKTRLGSINRGSDQRIHERYGNTCPSRRR